MHMNIALSAMLRALSQCTLTCEESVYICVHVFCPPCMCVFHFAFFSLFSRLFICPLIKKKVLLCVGVCLFITSAYR